MRHLLRSCSRSVWAGAVRVAMALLLTWTSSAHAHFLYTTSEATENGVQGIVFFSESAQSGPSHLPAKIASASAWWRPVTGERQSLQLKASDDKPVLSAGVEGQVGSVESSCTYGVYKNAFLLQYCAKHIRYQTDEQLATLSRTPEFTFDAAIKRVGRSVEVHAFLGEKPLAGATIAWTDPAETTTEATTDESGVARFDLLGPGLYSVRALYADKQAQGEFEGQSYREAQHYTTVSFVVADEGSSTPKVPALPEATSSFGAAVLDDWVYIYSGHTGKEHAHSRDNLAKRFIRASLSGSGEGQAWEELPMEAPLQGLALVGHQGQLYRVGGLSAKNSAEEPADLHSVADVARFDVSSKSWTAISSLPKPRSSHDAVVLNGRIYVVGGWHLSGSSDGDWLNEALSLDLSNPQASWESLEQPFQRRALAAAAFDGKLYVIGGMDAEHQISRSVDIYDPATGSWSKGPDLPGEGMQGFGVSAWAHEQSLYVCGSNGEVYRLQPGDLHWYRHSALATGRFFHRLLPAGSQGLIAIGGASVEKRAHLTDAEFIPFLIPVSQTSASKAVQDAK